MVTEATNEIALPFNVVTDELVLLAGEDNVTPEFAMMVPFMIPPPA